MEENKKNLGLPIAIVIAGILIAGAVIYSTGSSKPETKQAPSDTSTSQVKLEAMNPVSSSDHILGNPDAKIVMVEYSDLECPYCKVFQTTGHALFTKYGTSSDMAWVFRNFPLDKPVTEPDGTVFTLHSKAGTEAQASECAASIGGNTAFWNYIDKIYSITPSNNGLDLSLLPKTAANLGLDQTKFQNCLSSSQTKSAVDAQYQNGVNIGIEGTPFLVLVLKNPISKTASDYILSVNAQIMQSQPAGSPSVITISSDGKRISVSGALPYGFFTSIFDKILGNS